MGSFRNRVYEEDPFDKEIRSIYDEIDDKMKNWEEDKQYLDIEAEADPDFWKEDVEMILSDLRFDPDFVVPTFPKEQLDRIEKYYARQSEFINEDAMIEDVDPLPDYVAGNGSVKNELYKLGYAVGAHEQIGKYYKLLPFIYFSRGYWLGKFERAVQEDNDDLILEVAREMRIVNPKTAEKELTSIVNRCFTDIVNIEDPNERKEEDFYLK